MGNNRYDAKEYLKRIESQYHPDMKLPTLTGTNFEEFDLYCTAAVSILNASIGIPVDYLLRLDPVGNYDAAQNSCEEKLSFCANLQGKSSNYDSETLYNLLVQYFGTSVTGRNTVSRHTRFNNGRKCYLKLKGHFKTEAYEETKAAKSNAILQSAYYDGNRKFTLEHYYNLVSKAFFQLQEAGPIYTLKEYQKIDSWTKGAYIYQIFHLNKNKMEQATGQSTDF